MNPKASVVLTSYNHADFIGKTIESVLSQSFQDYELIVLDNCSTDHSIEVIKEYEAKDKRVKLVQNENNLGMVMSVNKGVRLAQGEYVAHLCADDLWKPEKLEKQVEYLDNNNDAAVCFTAVEVISENGEILGDNHFYQKIFDKAENKSRVEWLKTFFFDGNVLCFPSAMVRKSCFDEVGLYDPRYQIALDVDMWVRICSKFDIHLIEEKLTNFRSGENSLSSQSSSAGIFEEEMNQVCQHYANLDKKDFAELFGISVDRLSSEREMAKELIRTSLDNGKYLTAARLFANKLNDIGEEDAEFLMYYFKKRSEYLKEYQNVRIGKTYRMVQKIKNIEKGFKKLIGIVS
jgi:glycosyltransferase involved in cell wall biosynthesis